MIERNKESVETYNKSASNYQDKFMKMDLYNDTFDTFCELIEDENSKILEIASGPGNVTKYLLGKKPDLKILGIDLAPNMIEFAKENNPKAEFKVFDCREISKIELQFDGIMCGFCMPYLSKEECEKLIYDASKLLNSSGLLYISTMEDDYEKSGYELTSFSGENRVYIYYHQAEFLSECLKKYGYEVIDLQRKKYPEPDGTFLTDMIFIARKK
ncbi:methyltransferase domain-containing protein [Polaribacter undariae]|uniref:Methyltransferase domain-containing protein n=1 Tax=Polaribacter sejongensis TaxID=985043 RepID=A0AAJ1QXJ5_9FLAO|nr:class I SAM-dependent methyltransferase [Polaribacter undariae]MDN3620179.1 methyltransferase domain-containing protein [Polaribacter undariae]UWD32580.1 methyltransferase domain-containing protein [Polaribacter undariae]